MRLKRRLFAILFAVIGAVAVFLFSFNRLFPIITARVEQYLRSYATEVIGSSVSDVLSEGIEYEELVDLNCSEDGNVLALSCNTSGINVLKSKISLRILEKLSERENSVLKIPIGNLSGSYIFSGRGFDVSVRLIAADSVLTSVESSFTEVGINQSWHKITVKVELRLGVIILGRHTYVDVSDSVPIADTVIVGGVPDAYTKIEKTDSETVGDIVDFSATTIRE